MHGKTVRRGRSGLPATSRHTLVAKSKAAAAAGNVEQVAPEVAEPTLGVGRSGVIVKTKRAPGKNVAVRVESLSSRPSNS